MQTQRKSIARRVLAWSGLVVASIAVLAAVPIVRNEWACMAPRRADATAAPPSLIAPEFRRAEVNTYLTYPEWSIVHAYEDLAAVTARSREADYDAFGAIGRYWGSLCSISRYASARGDIGADYKVMLYTIGLSFTAEMGMKGLYEKTMGRLTSLLTRGWRTPEDVFALQVAQDYARFLRQVPWYEYPFGATLVRFWRETPIVGGAPVRKIERRFALSLEWGAKALYAQLIALGAAASPAALRIRSAVSGLTEADLAADPRLTLVRRVGDVAIVETDRYATFTDILVKLALAGRDLVEIAGNRSIMVTVLSEAPSLKGESAPPVLFAVPIETRPGWYRLVVDVKVAELTAFLRDLDRARLVLDHVYDY